MTVIPLLRRRRAGARRGLTVRVGLVAVAYAVAVTVLHALG